ncbi:MAG: hypothetical protein ACRC9V_08020 [Aeromonas sp.]
MRTDFLALTLDVLSASEWQAEGVRGFGMSNERLLRIDIGDLVQLVHHGNVRGGNAKKTEYAYLK